MYIYRRKLNDESHIPFVLKYVDSVRLSLDPIINQFIPIYNTEVSTQPPYPNGSLALFPCCKAAGSEADHSPPSTSEVKNACNCTSTPPTHLHVVMLS